MSVATFARGWRGRPYLSPEVFPWIRSEYLSSARRSNPNRPMASSELVEVIERLLRRLRRAMDALDAGDLSGADDIASHLRTLIGRGAGNLALARLARELDLPLPRVQVSNRPEKGRDVVLSVGNLPLGTAERGFLGQNDHSLPFNDWTSAVSLVLRGALRPEVGWQYLVEQAGNTTGSHVSTTLPDILDKSRLFSVTGLDLERYLLRQVAWQVERILQDLLVRSGRTVVIRDRSIYIFDSCITWMSCRMPSADRMEWVLDGYTARHPAEIISYEFEGTHRVSTLESGQLRYEAPAGFLDRRTD